MVFFAHLKQAVLVFAQTNCIFLVIAFFLRFFDTTKGKPIRMYVCMHVGEENFQSKSYT